MKTQEELTVLRDEVETLKTKLAELSDEELELVNGGTKLVPSMIGFGEGGIRQRKASH